MLLERIDIDTFGALEGVQLGPFSHRLNAVYGPPGAGKTATVEFLRSVMLGTERDWYHGGSGRVVWANHEGLLQCRREADGTPHGRLMVDYHARDGRPYDHQYGYRSPANYQRLHRLVDLPRDLLDCLVAPASRRTAAEIAAACHHAGLQEEGWGRNEPEIARLQSELQRVERELNDTPPETASTEELQSRRRQLTERLAALRRLESERPSSEPRAALESRLAELGSEVTRLRRQEADLRQALAKVDHQLSELVAQWSGLPQPSHVASARRRQLEAHDDQLVRLCAAQREVRGLREDWDRLDAGDLLEAAESTKYGAHDAASRHARRVGRLQALRRQIEGLVDRQPRDTSTPGEAPGNDHRAEQLLASIRTLVEALSAADSFRSFDGRRYEDDLRRAENLLNEAIEHLIGSRDRLLQRVSEEYGISLSRLSDAFGDWTRCHAQPQLYQWLLSDQFPPAERATDHDDARRTRMLNEQRELLDELHRTANRLDNSVTESRQLEDQLRRMPIPLPVIVDEQQVAELRRALAEIENALRRAETRRSLLDLRQQLSDRLTTLRSAPDRSSALGSRTRFWLEQFGAVTPELLSQLDRFLRHPAAAFDPAEPQQPTDVERHRLTLALRMAAAERLRNRGTQIPLVVDEPNIHWLGDVSPSRLAEILSQFTENGQQLVLFTAQRGVAESIRAAGGNCLELAPGRYFQIRYREPRSQWPQQVNRELDAVWRESQGLDDDFPAAASQPPAAPPPPALREDSLDHWRSPSEYADSTTSPTLRDSSGANLRTASPFFLTEQSPVDQAPSIDAVAAQRLRGLGVQRVGQLLDADPSRLAERLQLADVTATVVRRWQDEARLVCGVPQLRNFDARVLVGCGFTDPSQLARMHPGHLLEKVEQFLATARGQQILRTGTSYELSRITSWIAAANRSVARRHRHLPPEESSVQETTTHEDRVPKRRRKSRRQPRAGEVAARHATAIGKPAAASAATAALRFYLELDSPIVDAPSIGPKLASRLRRAGYRKVRHFVFADPADVAQTLNHPRLNAEKIGGWQRQAKLMCQVPMLRGHDAQLLVAAEVDRPEQLAECDARWLLGRVQAVARSSRGKRILRDGTAPDIEEVTRWIEWAGNSRSLKAA
jgi:hypothetical protein